jgi:formylglycine-generating enzyme required for sulfatase activity
LDWVTIPSGEFLFGEDKRKRSLPKYQISRYPVTNLQYKYFLNAHPDHPPPAYWKGPTFPVSKMYHPVVGVSFYDALAFCKWMRCRLPTQAEWEKAARGDDGRIYPWGEDWQDGKYCNNWEAKVRGTTPVEKFKAGASPFGVRDMVGNVWEWTASEDQGPYMHVLRGGSWRSFGQFAVRITQRDSLAPGDSRDDIGFRCARSV